MRHRAGGPGDRIHHDEAHSDRNVPPCVVAPRCGSDARVGCRQADMPRSLQNVRARVSPSYLAENDMPNALKRVATVIVAVFIVFWLRARRQPEPESHHPRIPVRTAGLDLRGPHRPRRRRSHRSRPSSTPDRSAGSRSESSRPAASAPCSRSNGGYLGWEAAGEEGYPVAWYSSRWDRLDTCRPRQGGHAMSWMDGPARWRGIGGSDERERRRSRRARIRTRCRDLRHVASGRLGDH